MEPATGEENLCSFRNAANHRQFEQFSLKCLYHHDQPENHKTQPHHQNRKRGEEVSEPRDQRKYEEEHTQHNSSHNNRNRKKDGLPRMKADQAVAVERFDS